MRCQGCHRFIELESIVTCDCCLAVLCSLCHAKHRDLILMEWRERDAANHDRKRGRRRHHDQT